MGLVICSTSAKARRRVIAFALLFFAAFPGRPSLAQERPALEPLSAFPRSVIEIRTHGGNVHPISVWIADRPARQEQGLMFVRQLPEHQGMLFVYPRERQISMWMKNTLIPLDMLFIRTDGAIAHIAARTTPASLDIITAPQPVRAVLEIAGGLAAELGIREGDRVFGKALSVSPTASEPRGRR